VVERERMMFITKPLERLVILGPVHQCVRHNKYKKINNAFFGTVCKGVVASMPKRLSASPQKDLAKKRRGPFQKTPEGPIPTPQRGPFQHPRGAHYKIQRGPFQDPCGAIG